MPYAIPPWVGPNAALGYGELAGGAQRAALSAQLERERMSQQAAQSALETQQRSQQLAQENQARQNELNYNHIVDQQKLAIEQAYKDQTLGLQKQDQELAQKQFQAKTDLAAKAYMDDQKFQKGMIPKDQGGEGLTAIQSALKYKSGSMSATELGRLSALERPPATVRPAQDVPGLPGYKAFDTGKGTFELRPTIPDVMTSAPSAIPVTDENGNVIAHYGINPATHKPELIRMEKGTGFDLKEAVNERAKELGITPGEPRSTDRKAQGGYKIGTVYKGGLRYIGGDPKDEKSWENVSPSEPEHSGPPGNETTYMMTGRTNK